MGSTRASKAALKKEYKEITDERAKQIRSEIDNARSLDNEALGALAVELAGRRKIWHIVKKAIREKVLKKS